MAHTHYFPTDRVHFQWDTSNDPVIEIDSGDTVIVETRDVSDNQIGPDSTTDVVAGLDWDRVYPLAGPIAVRGAEPGDARAGGRARAGGGPARGRASRPPRARGGGGGGGRPPPRGAGPCSPRTSPIP